MSDDLTDDDHRDDDATVDEAGDDERGDEGRPGPAAAYAPNWRTVLLVDALVGVAVMAVGVWLSITWNPVGGGFLGSLGLVYVVLVFRRGRTWAARRRDAGY